MFVGFDRHATSEHLLVAIIEALCKAGHSVHIIQKNTEGPLPVIPETLSGYPVTTDLIPFKPADKGNLIARYLTEMKYVRQCKEKIKAGYDAVFIQSNYVAGFAVNAIRRKMPDVPVTFNVQDVFPYNAMYSGKVGKKSVIFKTLAFLQRRGYKRSNRIITISEDMKETLVSDGTPAGKIEVIYNWSYRDEPYKDVDISPVEHMFNKDYFNVTYAGNIGVMQNVELIVEAARILKDEKGIWFNIVGNGLYKEKLQSMVAENGITNISFWTLLPPELSPAVYCASDVNVIPLVKNAYKTALPSKTATCLACPTPVVFAIGKESVFCQKAVKGADCRSIDANRPDELVDAILKLRGGEHHLDTGDFFEKYCSVSLNSMKYAEIITQTNGRQTD